MMKKILAVIIVAASGVISFFVGRIAGSTASKLLNSK